MPDIQSEDVAVTGPVPDVGTLISVEREFTIKARTQGQMVPAGSSGTGVRWPVSSCSSSFSCSPTPRSGCWGCRAGGPVVRHDRHGAERRGDDPRPAASVRRRRRVRHRRPPVRPGRRRPRLLRPDHAGHPDLVADRRLASGSSSTVLGVIVGAFSGYYRGATESVLMRFTDLMLTIPLLVIAAVVAAEVLRRGSAAAGPGAGAVALDRTWPAWCAASSSPCARRSSSRRPARMGAQTLADHLPAHPAEHASGRSS